MEKHKSVEHGGLKLWSIYILWSCVICVGVDLTRMPDKNHVIKKITIWQNVESHLRSAHSSSSLWTTGPDEFISDSGLGVDCGCSSFEYPLVSSEYSLGVLWVFSLCPLSILWVSSEYSLDVLWVFFECPLSILWVSSVCQSDRSSSSLGEPTATRSAVFLNIVQKAFDPPPLRFEHHVANFFWWISLKAGKRLSRQNSTK